MVVNFGDTPELVTAVDLDDQAYLIRAIRAHDLRQAATYHEVADAMNWATVLRTRGRENPAMPTHCASRTAYAHAIAASRKLNLGHLL